MLVGNGGRQHRDFGNGSAFGHDQGETRSNRFVSGVKLIQAVFRAEVDPDFVHSVILQKMDEYF